MNEGKSWKVPLIGLWCSMEVDTDVSMSGTSSTRRTGYNRNTRKIDIYHRSIKISFVRFSQSIIRPLNAIYLPSARDRLDPPSLPVLSLSSPFELFPRGGRLVVGRLLSADAEGPPSLSFLLLPPRSRGGCGVAAILCTLSGF